MSAPGVYVSIPFCKAKCSFCNFSSGVFAASEMERYVARVGDEMRQARGFAAALGAELPGVVDSVYLGGGTPSLLPPELIAQLFAGMRAEFVVDPDAEITVECAPGQLEQGTLEALQLAGVNRLSFGVQSLIDAEAAAVGRLHTGASALAELERVRAAGIRRVGIDLIAGLPHQTEASWRRTLDLALASGVEHVSVYMLEVDEDSRLGQEALSGGTRYGAAALPDADRVADWYTIGCEMLAAGGVEQYEISNFARAGGQSRHNRKYWERTPYLGFGMDAHSMMRAGRGGVRWANPDAMPAYVHRLGTFERTIDRVDARAAFEESLFLGLRLVEGVSRAALDPTYLPEVEDALAELSGLVEDDGTRLRLTHRGGWCRMRCLSGCCW